MSSSADITMEEKVIVSPCAKPEAPASSIHGVGTGFELETTKSAAKKLADSRSKLNCSRLTNPLIATTTETASNNALNSTPSSPPRQSRIKSRIEATTGDFMKPLRDDLPSWRIFAGSGPQDRCHA